MDTLSDEDILLQEFEESYEKLLPIRQLYYITEDTFQNLRKLKKNGHSVVNPPILSWSSYGIPELEITRKILLNIDGVEKMIYTCLATWNKVVIFLEEHCLSKVEASCVMFCWQEQCTSNSTNSITLSHMPPEIMRVVVQKVFE